jgi:hypothetical protein
MSDEQRPPEVLAVPEQLEQPEIGRSIDQLVAGFGGQGNAA